MRTKLALLIAAISILSGCSSAGSEANLTVANAFIRATDEMSGPITGPWMTGAFMEITNNTDTDVTLIGGSAAFAAAVEIHEVVDGTMRMKAAGLTIKAGTTEKLLPGGNHVMFLQMPEQTRVGEEYVFTLTFSDGTSVEVSAPVKEVALGSENYDNMNM